MKRVWPAWLFLFLGGLFLTVAAVAQFWAPSHAERTPLDSYQRTYLTGHADLLDAATGKTSPTPVKITNITEIDNDSSTDSTIVFITSTCVNKDVNDPADCLPPLSGGKTDPRVISVTKLNFAADRHTAEAVEDPAVKNDPPVQGLVNKWPFYPKKTTYKVWDDTSKQATDATYVGETTVQGLKCYQYHQVITDAPIDLGSNIDGLYNLDETYTIDAVTGKIINQQLHDVRNLTPKEGGQTALDLTAAYTPDTISTNVSDAKSGGKQLTLITKVLPIVGLIAGVLCVIAGFVLLARSRRGNGSGDHAAGQPPVTASA